MQSLIEDGAVCEVGLGGSLMSAASGRIVLEFVCLTPLAFVCVNMHRKAPFLKCLHVFVHVSCKKYNSPNTCGTKLEVNAYVVLVCQIPLFLIVIDGRISELMTVNRQPDHKVVGHAKRCRYSQGHRHRLRGCSTSR